MRRMARERVIIKTSITALVFAFVFSISAFFSFTYYYNNIFKLSSKKIVGELQPMELAADIVLPTAKEVAARYDENTAQLEATPGFKSYLDQLEALSETARTADATLRELIRKSQEARQRVVAGSRAAGRRRSRRGPGGKPAARRRKGADTAIGARRRRSRRDHQGQAGRNLRLGDHRETGRAGRRRRLQGARRARSLLRSQLPFASRQIDGGAKARRDDQGDAQGADRRARQRPAPTRRAGRRGDLLEAEGRQRRRGAGAASAEGRSRARSRRHAASARRAARRIARRPELARRARGQALVRGDPFRRARRQRRPVRRFQAISPASRLARRRATV